MKARPSHSATRGGRGRPGFTMLEVMLAAVLGTMVVLATLGLFAAIERQSIIGRHHFEETLELGLMHETAQRAMQLLLIAETPMPIVRAADRQNPAGTRVTEPAQPQETPRLILAADPAHAIMMLDDRGQAHQPQRLELALRAPPVFVRQPEQYFEELDSKRRLTFRRQRELEEEENNEDTVELTIAPGIRGVFELTPNDGRHEGTFSLWWRQLTVHSDGAEGLTAPAAHTVEPDQVGSVMLASNLTYCKWQVFRSHESSPRGRFLDEWTATWQEELPGFVTLEVITSTGTRHNWLLEVGWALGKEPGTVTRTQRRPEGTIPQRPGQPQQPGNVTPVTTPRPGKDPQRPSTPPPRQPGMPDERSE